MEHGIIPGSIWHDPLTGMEFILVPGCTFQMGDLFDYGEPDEQPVHEVSLDPYWLGRYPVTQGEWVKVMGKNPSFFPFDRDTYFTKVKPRGWHDYPIENVSWNDVQEFIIKLNAHGNGSFRLPTEAEWEYACRSGGEKELYSGGDHDELVAWNLTSCEDQTTHPVGMKESNGLGFYDMSGNVYEWVSDWYGENYYANSPHDNPQGPSEGECRVIRGGHWESSSHSVRSTYRYAYAPEFCSYSVGFRLARSI